MSEARFFMAIDGGGTKTVGLVADDSGRILGWGLGGAANTNFTSVEQARRSLSDAIQGAWRRAGPPPVPPTLAFLSGPVPGNLAEELAREETGVATLSHAGEGLTAWYAALAFRQFDCGVAVGAGTGAIAWGMNRRGQESVASAWGGLLGDEGSGYWIGVEAMRAIVRAEDGREPPTALRAAIAAHFQISNLWDLVRLVYQKPLDRREIAALAPLVAEVARQGDAKACEILARAGQELALAASAVIRKLGLTQEAFPLVPFGSVFKAGDCLMRPFWEAVQQTAPRATLAPLRYEPVIGTLLIALQRGGVVLDDTLLANLDATLAVVPFPLKRN